MKFLTAHYETSFKDSEVSPPFRKVLEYIYNNIEGNEEVIRILSGCYGGLEHVSPTQRWSTALDRALTHFVLYDPTICEDIVNNIIIPNHPLKSYMQPFEVRLLGNRESVAGYFADLEMQLLRSEMHFLCSGKHFDNTKFSPDHIKILSFLYKFMQVASWKDPSNAYHSAFIIRCVINSPLLSIQSLLEQLSQYEIPSIEGIANELFVSVAKNSRFDDVKTLKQLTRENEISDSYYYNFIRNVMSNQKLEFISPDFFLELLDRTIVNPPKEIKGMETCISVIKQQIMNFDDDNLFDQTCFWVYYGNYANWLTLDKKKMKKYWVSSIYSLAYEISQLQIAGNVFDKILTELSSFYAQPNLELLADVVSYGHVPTANLLISKLRSEIILEGADKLLLSASETNYNNICEFLVKNSGLTFSLDALMKAQSYAHLNWFGSLEQVIKCKLALIEEATFVSVIDEIKEFESILAAAVDDSCSNFDDQIILYLIEDTELEKIDQITAQGILIKLAKSERAKPVLAICHHWMSKLSHDFRKNLLAVAAKHFHPEIFEILIGFKEFLSSYNAIVSIFNNAVSSDNSDILKAILKHWAPHISHATADHALLTAVSLDLRDQVKILTDSDLELTEKGVFNALKHSIVSRNFCIYEFLVSDDCEIDFDENELAIAKIMAEDQGYRLKKRSRHD